MNPYSFTGIGFRFGCHIKPISIQEKRRREEEKKRRREEEKKLAQRNK